MKKLTNLKGVKILNKSKQKEISGSGSPGSCYQQSGHICCQTFPSGFVLCDAGKCNYSPFGGYSYGCFWY